MKIRMGFVSNSSSASFTIIWKNYAYDVGESCIKESIVDLFDLSDYDQFDLSKEDIEDLIEITQIRPDGSLSTEFYTSMFNDFSSFGPTFIKFCGCLFAKDRDGSIVVLNKCFKDEH